MANSSNPKATFYMTDSPLKPKVTLYMTNSTQSRIKSQEKNQESCSQHKQHMITRHRRARREFYQLSKVDMISQDMVNYLYKCPNKVANKIIELMYRYALRNKTFYASDEWTSKLLGVREDYISKVTGDLARIGIIQKTYHGFGKGKTMILNPVLFKPAVSTRLSGIFKVLKSYAFQFVLATGGLSLELIMSTPVIAQQVAKDRPDLFEQKDHDLTILGDIKLLKSGGCQGEYYFSIESPHVRAREEDRSDGRSIEPFYKKEEYSERNTIEIDTIGDAYWDNQELERSWESFWNS